MPHTGVLLQPQKTNYRRHLTDTIKKESYTSNSLLTWCHQGLMYPCKHLYLNALPLAYIKKPRDWHV